MLSIDRNSGCPLHILGESSELQIAAIKSALLTSSVLFDNSKSKADNIPTKKPRSCPSLRSSSADLNYPSFSVVFKPLDLMRATRRSVTNVGAADSVYEIRVENPPSVNIVVEPTTLVFKTQNEKANYTVRFESKVASDRNSSRLPEFGQISWKCVKGGTQVVRSPVAIVWKDE